jgi:hypothetical protein
MAWQRFDERISHAGTLSTSLFSPYASGSAIAEASASLSLLLLLLL